MNGKPSPLTFSRLCLTLHMNEGSYLTHTQGKKHSTNLARRAQKEQKDLETGAGVPIPPSISNNQRQAPSQIFSHMPIRKILVKIGRPGYKVTKVYISLAHSRFVIQ